MVFFFRKDHKMKKNFISRILHTFEVQVLYQRTERAYLKVYSLRLVTFLSSLVAIHTVVIEI